MRSPGPRARSRRQFLCDDLLEQLGIGRSECERTGTYALPGQGSVSRRIKGWAGVARGLDPAGELLRRQREHVEMHVRETIATIVARKAAEGETTCTSSGDVFDVKGLAGSRSWDPIQATPPKRMTVRRGIDQTFTARRRRRGPLPSGGPSGLLCESGRHGAPTVMAAVGLDSSRSLLSRYAGFRNDHCDPRSSGERASATRATLLRITRIWDRESEKYHAISGSDSSKLSALPPVLAITRLFPCLETSSSSIASHHGAVNILSRHICLYRHRSIYQIHIWTTLTCEEVG
jgi:hypothetical protein